MQAIAFLKELEKLRKPVILLNDIARIIGKNKEYTRIYVHRLKERGLIKEIEKGKYALSDDPFEISSNLVFPSYISFITTYFIYGFTTQIPVVIHIVCSRPKMTICLENIEINFITFKKENIFGYKREHFRNKYIFIAEPEKAVVDSLYLPKYCPISETYEALKSKGISQERIIEYALRMNSIVTLKRLGYLMELNGIDIHKKVKHKLNSRYDLLNPFIKRSQTNSSRWKLNINEVFE
ncbi:hypothetical protein COT48_03265 [Candidatus Woesearchaeota archaeon CG08_land_8_20_14_0_20_47_9]|nr:MAG: hypothetical protein COT48_03265 [Candidatus Woesearchaeota archaeon CG08_land_8_20_14_0_20_47_9]